VQVDKLLIIMQTEKPETLNERALGMAPKTPLRESLLQILKNLGLWSGGEAIFAWVKPCLWLCGCILPLMQNPSQSVLLC